MFVSLNSYSISFKIKIAVDTCRYHTVYVCFQSVLEHLMWARALITPDFIIQMESLVLL